MKREREKRNPLNPFCIISRAKFLFHYSCFVCLMPGLIAVAFDRQQQVPAKLVFSHPQIQILMLLARLSAYFIPAQINTAIILISTQHNCFTKSFACSLSCILCSCAQCQKQSGWTGLDRYITLSVPSSGTFLRSHLSQLTTQLDRNWKSFV